MSEGAARGSREERERDDNDDEESNKGCTRAVGNVDLNVGSDGWSVMYVLLLLCGRRKKEGS